MCTRCSGNAAWVGSYYLSGRGKFLEISASRLYLFQKINKCLHNCLAQYKKIKAKRKLSKSRRRKSYGETQTRAPKSQVGAPVRRGRPTLGCPISSPSSFCSHFFTLLFLSSNHTSPLSATHTPQLRGNLQTLHPNPLQRGPTSPPLDPKQFSFTADGLKKKKKIKEQQQQKSHFLIC